MTTTQSEIAGWFDAGKERNCSHLIVACDTFDHEDFPVYVERGQDFWAVFGQYHIQPDKMLRVMEVYDLSADKDEQLKEHRAWRLPQRTE